MDGDELLTPEQVGVLLGGEKSPIKLSTLATWRTVSGRVKNDLPFLKIGRAVRYRRSDVLKFIEKGTVIPVPKTFP